MNAQRKSKQFVISTVCLAMIALWPGRTSAQTSLDIKAYAQACMKELAPDASKPIDFPTVLQCADGAILPITQNAVAIPAQTAADGSKFTDQTKCDSPPLLGISSGRDRSMCAEFAAAGHAGTADRCGAERPPLLRAAVPQLQVSLAGVRKPPSPNTTMWP